MDKVKIIGIIENILFTAGEAVAIKDLAMALDMDKYVLQQLLEEEMTDFDILTWVPVSPLRRFKRGYDQVELLANEVGRELGIEPVRTLHKFRNNRPQSGISGTAQRRANVLGVYRAVNRDAIRDKRILLLDDIITTGATAGE